VSCRIEVATAADAGAILTLIRGLAGYERLAHEVVATEDDLRRTLVGPRPAAEALLAYADVASGAAGAASHGALSGAAPVGFALFFTSYSTFLGKPGIYLEDLFVLPAHRGHGIGKALFRRVAQIAVERDCGRMEWSVLDWNEPALKFYRAMGAQPMDEWTVQRLTGETLRAAAQGGS
jgi:GNAT superfamily N-acetyltransferase